jgi:hypothetical protein
MKNKPIANTENDESIARALAEQGEQARRLSSELKAKRLLAKPRGKLSYSLMEASDTTVMSFEARAMCIM